MGRLPAYLLAALLAAVAGAPAAWAQGQAYPTASYPYGTQQYAGGYSGYGTGTTYSSYPYYGSSAAAQYGAYPYGQWGSTTAGYNPSTTYGYGPTSQYGYGSGYGDTGSYGYYGYGQPGTAASGYYGYGQPSVPPYGSPFGQPAPYGQSAPYGQPAPYAGSPASYPPPYGAPYTGAPNAYGYSPTSNPSYPAPYGALPPPSPPPTDPYNNGQLVSNPYGPSPYGAAPASYPQVSQTSQPAQTGCGGNCTLGTYFYGVGVPTSTPYSGSNNQITPYNVGGLASALTGVNMPVQNTQPMQFPDNIPVSQY